MEISLLFGQQIFTMCTSDVFVLLCGYPTLGTSTAIISEGMLTSDLEAQRFFQIRFLEAADVDMVFMHKVLKLCLFV